MNLPSMFASVVTIYLTSQLTDVLPDRVVVYLWSRREPVKFNFKFRPRLGLNARTAPSTIYDYYNPDSRAVVAPATFKVR